MFSNLSERSQVKHTAMYQIFFFLKIGLGQDLDTYGIWKFIFMFNVPSKSLNVHKAP